MCRIRHYFRGNQVQDPNPISASTQFHTGRMPFQVHRGSPRAGVQLIACSLLICRPFLVTLLICSVICRLPWVAHTSHHAYATSARPRAHICFSRSANVNCLWGTKKKKKEENERKKNTIRGTANTAQIFALKYLPHVSDKRPRGKWRKGKTPGNAGARKHGKMENWDRCGRSVFLFAPAA